MTDEELVHAFEHATLAADQFPHAAHVRVAWWYLRRHPLGDALPRFRAALKHFAARHGAEGKYHETVTVAYMLLIAERLEQARDLDWDAFASRNADLMARQPSVLISYYSEQVLQSARARRTFVLPDLDGAVPLAGSGKMRVATSIAQP